MTPHFPIYLDYGATTPVDPRVVDAMIPWLREHFGNPASRSHAWGWEAEAIVEKSREQVAALIGADPREIVWTSGATESNNLAIKGAAHFYKGRGKHIITVKTEHKAVLDTVRELERQGFEATYLDVEPNGLLDLDKFNPFWTWNPTFKHIHKLLFESYYPWWLWNTMYVAICATILSIIASVLAAYAIVRLRYRGAQWVGGLIFASSAAQV